VVTGGLELSAWVHRLPSRDHRPDAQNLLCSAHIALWHAAMRLHLFGCIWFPDNYPHQLVWQPPTGSDRVQKGRVQNKCLHFI